AAVRLEDDVPVREEDLPRERRDGLLVLDDEDRLAAADLDRREAAARRALRLLVHHREHHADGGALPGRGLDRDLSAALLDDAVGRREPEAGALAALLRREERLEE